jgi:glutamyl-tRNA synthetase
MFARSRGGAFILRIEDTDRKRSKKRYLEDILGSLKWLGIDWDELYFQSQRLKLYREYAQRLLEENKAYLEGKAIKFRLPQERVEINDLIHGKIEFDAGLIKDQVLIKSDGSPSYNFACVIDDATLNISHVIRGDDHISNTPKQLALFRTLKFGQPQFAHMPLILSPGGGRLSKRTGAMPISHFKKDGFLPEALFNYLLLLGWSPGNNREIISPPEAISRFSLRDIVKTSATFDLDKLKWINSHYIKQADIERLTDLAIPILKRKRFLPRGLQVEKGSYDRQRLSCVLKLFQNRISTFGDFIQWADYFFLKSIKIEPQAKEKLLAKDLSKEFGALIERLRILSPFDAVTTEAAFRGLVAQLNISTRELIHPVRAALTGKTVGPGLFEIMETLGKERVIERLNRAVKVMKTRS